MDEGYEAEDELQHRQGALYPVGRALRSTFDADNHDTLGSDVTGLMLELARVPVEPCARDITLAKQEATAPPGLLGRMRGLLRF